LPHYALHPEKNMKHPIQQLVLSLLCAGAVGGALAAQPETLPPATQRAPGVSTSAPLVVVSTPGTLHVFKVVATEVEAGKPLNFRFEGIGHCRIKLDGGDGYARDVEGKLPFSADYIYGTGSMSSFAAFKDYSASASPQGNCKTSGALPAIKVRVINPAPQGVPAAGSQGPVISSSNPGLTVAKPKP
jgi:hypothetical protein